MTPSNNYDMMFENNSQLQLVPNFSTLDSSMNSPGTPLILKEQNDTPTFTDLLSPPLSEQEHHVYPSVPVTNTDVTFKKNVGDLKSTNSNVNDDADLSPTSLSSVPKHIGDGIDLHKLSLNDTLIESTSKTTKTASSSQHISSAAATATTAAATGIIPSLKPSTTTDGGVDQLKKPMIHSDSYQNLLKKYCFYKGPSTVSSFLETGSGQSEIKGSQQQPSPSKTQSFTSPSFY
ncbi:unnamed protein product [Ambrosiozyma monospora]|uniref:Unnamed protein product n=1 Tax=Ambrosiozyma monospora TaxID=43982 RepID=A0ACB5THS6_AMBMO|nr:unnamed protein product [Ambrosiozyma monospora]